MANENGHGGARANSGGPRVNSGGARSGAGRPRKAEPANDDGAVNDNQDPADIFRWYVVRTVHGQTALAEQEITEAGFDVMLARKCIPATRARRSATGSLIRAREERYDPLFVRYVIVRLNLTDPSWRLIPEMDSVERIISGSHASNHGVGRPLSIPDSAIDALRLVIWESRPRMAGAAALPGVWYPPGYRPRVDDADDEIPAGTELRVPEGPLADLAAVCAASDGKRVMMLMHWFNRDDVPTHTRQAAVEVV